MLAGRGRIALGGLHVKLGEDAVEPARQPPGFLAEELHDRRDQDRADDHGVDEDGGGEPEAEEFDDAVVADHEGGEDGGHDRRGGGDHASGQGEAAGDRFGRVLLPLPLLVNPRHQEDLVVHREPEDDREEEDREEGDDRAGAVDPDQAGAPSPLEDGDDQPEGGADAEQVHHHGLQRHQDRAEDDHQQQRREQDDDADEERQLVGDRRPEVLEDRGDAADVHLGAGLGLDRRDHLAADVVEQLGRLLAFGRGRRVDLEDG